MKFSSTILNYKSAPCLLISRMFPSIHAACFRSSWSNFIFIGSLIY